MSTEHISILPYRKTQVNTEDLGKLTRSQREHLLYDENNECHYYYEFLLDNDINFNSITFDANSGCEIDNTKPLNINAIQFLYELTGYNVSEAGMYYTKSIECAYGYQAEECKFHLFIVDLTDIQPEKTKIKNNNKHVIWTAETEKSNDPIVFSLIYQFFRNIL